MSDFHQDYIDKFYDQYFKTDVSEPSEGRTISNIIKEYPDMLTIYIYHNDYKLKNNASPHVKELLKETRKQDNIHRSLRRSKSTVKDIIQSNSWDLWCTFTFNQAKVNRYDMSACKAKMSNWLFNQHKHSPHLKYIIVPELHKDGALHFHALLANFNGKLKDTKIVKNGHTIYNATGYRSCNLR